MKTKILFLILILSLFSSSFICNKVVVKPGENRLTIDLKRDNREFNAQANVYLNSKFIGMTDKNGNLVINLRKGEYMVRISLDGYETWEETILMVGAGHKQNIYPNLKRIK
ncbi:MAG TPA: PEGA domain-containing protein [Bacteroidetes bacterium]|nr:PEGA domain-containing protein [Bacteroidota bacterium]